MSKKECIILAVAIFGYFIAQGLYVVYSKVLHWLTSWSDSSIILTLQHRKKKMLFHIYNIRGVKVDYVDAVSEADALKHAKRKYPGAMVARWLTQAEQPRRTTRKSASSGTDVTVLD